MFSRHRKNISNAQDLRDIDLVRDGDAIAEIKLNRLDGENFGKLKAVVQASPLESLQLRDCFESAKRLEEILEAVVDNTAITNLVLELQDNACDVACIGELKKLLSRKILRSLVLPQHLDEFCLAEILHEIIDKSVQLKELNIACSVLDSNCLNLLKTILQNGLIRSRLGMMGCEGVANTTLTNRDKETLESAMRNSRSFVDNFPWKTKLKVVWFTHVLQAGPAAESDGTYEVCEIEDQIRPIFKGKLGKTEKVLRLIVRDKKGGPWLHLRSYRKRKREDKIFTTQTKKAKEDVDLLSYEFESQSLDTADGKYELTETVHGFESGKNTNSPKKNSSEHHIRRPSSVTVVAEQPISPMSKASGFADTPTSRQAQDEQISPTSPTILKVNAVLNATVGGHAWQTAATPSIDRHNNYWLRERKEAYSTRAQYYSRQGNQGRHDNDYACATVEDRSWRGSPTPQMDRRGYNLRQGNRQRHGDCKNFFDGSDRTISGRLAQGDTIKNNKQPTTSRTNYVGKKGWKGKWKKR